MASNTVIVKQAKIWPLLLIKGQEEKHAGAARLHVLACTLDHNEGCNHAAGICKGGSGKVLIEALHAAAAELGVKRSIFYNWMADGIKAGIFHKSKNFLYLASQENLSEIFKCDLTDVDKSKAEIPLKLLFKPGWKSIVWAAYLKVNHHKNVGTDEKMQPVYQGKVISSATLEDLTGISPRQQRRYKAYVKRKRNIAITTTAGSWETAETLNQAAQDHGKERHYFPFNDPQQEDPAGVRDYRRVIAHTIPMRRTVEDKHARIGAHGRRRQIIAAIEKRLTACDSLQLSKLSRTTPQQATPINGANRGTFKRARRIYYEPSKRKKRLAPDTQFQGWAIETPREAFVLRTLKRLPRRQSIGVWDRENA